ncbi:MAG: hypothetical protein H6625_03300 [Bdellovibrionaceae bacterium]|nr:hypothetical protein [Pseudobdellovibrionaceae bacterium]
MMQKLFKYTLSLLLIFYISGILLSPQSSFAKESPEFLAHQTQWFNQRFSSVIFDVRGSRGGHGDVAAGYLTIMDLISRYKFNGEITVLVDSKSLRILNKLSEGNQTFKKRVNFVSIDSLDQNSSFDMYIVLASPSGRFHFGSDIDEASSGEVSGGNRNKIYMKKNAVLLVHTVLGNTENPYSKNPFAVIRYQGVNYNMSPAGIAHSESGVYSDYAALELKAKSKEEIIDEVQQQLQIVQNESSRYFIQSLFKQIQEQKIEFGLAYGLTATTTARQFLSYLEGLMLKPSKIPKVILTPSAFKSAHITDPKLAARVKFLDEVTDLTKPLDPKYVYIYNSPTLPHKLFTTMLAYSMFHGLVPVGAGDGFTSAAINLGGPFVLTQVEWNAKNIANLKSRLKQVIRKNYTDKIKLTFFENLIDTVYEQVDLRGAQYLTLLRAVFDVVSEEVKELTGSIVNSAEAVTQWQQAKGFTSSDPSSILDPALIQSLMDGGSRETLKRASLLMGKYQLYIENILYGGKNNTVPKDIMHNLTEEFYAFTKDYKSILDFISIDDSAKPKDFKGKKYNSLYGKQADSEPSAANLKLNYPTPKKDEDFDNYGLPKPNDDILNSEAFKELIVFNKIGSQLVENDKVVSDFINEKGIIFLDEKQNIKKIEKEHEPADYNYMINALSKLLGRKGFGQTKNSFVQNNSASTCNELLK